MSNNLDFVRFVKITENAFNRSLADGYNFRSAYDYEIAPSETILALSDLQIDFPNDFYASMESCVPLALNGLYVITDVLYHDFKGNIGVHLYNFNKEPLTIKKGDIITVMVFHQMSFPIIEECIKMRNKENVLAFNKLTENAIALTKNIHNSAAFNLYSAYDYEIAPSERIIALTDLEISVPKDCYGSIGTCAGFAFKGIYVISEVIDQDNRENVSVRLVNFGKEVLKINKGDCIAQIICCHKSHLYLSH